MNELGQVSPSTGIIAATGTAETQAQTRRANLERARRTASADQVANARDAQARRAEQFRESTEIIQRAIGANTRLEIAEGQGANPFTYRAVDIDSGEIVSEWPPEQFASLVDALATEADTRGATVSGLLVNAQI